MRLRYRPAKPDDFRLVVGSWIDSYRTAHAAGMISMEDWQDIMAVQIQKVLSRRGVEVTVAYDADEQSNLVDLFGWLAIEHGYRVPTRTQCGGRWGTLLVDPNVPLVHYVCVKQNYRREGIARGLFKAAGIDPNSEFYYSCKTGVVSKLAGKIPRAKWNPLIARYRKTEEQTP